MIPTPEQLRKAEEQCLGCGKIVWNQHTFKDREEKDRYCFHDNEGYLLALAAEATRVAEMGLGAVPEKEGCDKHDDQCPPGEYDAGHNAARKALLERYAKEGIRVGKV